MGPFQAAKSDGPWASMSRWVRLSAARGDLVPCCAAHGGSLAGVTGGHAAALDAHGGLWMWGGNGCGQLGLGSNLEFVDTPTQPPFL